MTIGLEDLVVVGTRDAVLVAPMSRSDEVKNVVAQLAAAGEAVRRRRRRRGLHWKWKSDPDLIASRRTDIARVEDGYGPA